MMEERRRPACSAGTSSRRGGSCAACSRAPGTTASPHGRIPRAAGLGALRRATARHHGRPGPWRYGELRHFRHDDGNHAACCRARGTMENDGKISGAAGSPTLRRATVYPPQDGNRVTCCRARDTMENDGKTLRTAGSAALRRATAFTRIGR